MAQSVLRPQDRLRESGVPRPEAPQLSGLGSGLCCLHSWAKPA